MRWRAHTTSIALVVLAGGALGYAYLDPRERHGRRAEEARVERLRGLAKRGPHPDHDRARSNEARPRAREGRRRRLRVVGALTARRAGRPRSLRQARRRPRVRDRRAARSIPLASSPRRGSPRRGVRGRIDMGSVSHRFALGAEAPTPAGAGYLRIEGAPKGKGLVVAGQRCRDGGPSRPAEGTFRSRMLVPYVSLELARLGCWKRPEDGVDSRSARMDDVSFTLAPSGVRASRLKLDEVWGALAEMRAEAFLGGQAEADTLVRTPAVTITMTPTAHERARSHPRRRSRARANPTTSPWFGGPRPRLAVCAPGNPGRARHDGRRSSRIRTSSLPTTTRSPSFGSSRSFRGHPAARARAQGERVAGEGAGLARSRWRGGGSGGVARQGSRGHGGGGAAEEQ